jgi:hypothetical protein
MLPIIAEYFLGSKRQWLFRYQSLPDYLLIYSIISLLLSAFTHWIRSITQHEAIAVFWIFLFFPVFKSPRNWRAIRQKKGGCNAAPFLDINLILWKEDPDIP